MEDRETPRMRKYAESKMTRIMMATVPHVTSGSGVRKFQADGILLDRVYVVCPKSKCTDFLFNYLLDLPEITSYLLLSMTLGKLHSGPNDSSTDHSSTGSHFPEVCVGHRLQFFVCFP